MPDTTALRRLPSWIEPGTLFAGIPGPDSFWLDAGARATTGWSWVGVGTPGTRPDPMLGPRGADHGDQATVAAGAGGPFRSGWVGWSGYDGAAARAGAPAHSDDAAPEELWLRVDRVVAFDHASREVWLHAPATQLNEFEAEVTGWASTPLMPAAGEAPVPAATARHTPEEYDALIQRCRDAIRAGDAYQLCLTTRFEVAGTGIDPREVFLRLRAAASAPHAALIRSGGFALVSVSPERFLEVHDGAVRTSPIKGTRPRGVDPAADRALAAELLASPKERAENVMIVDLMRNDLQRVCVDGTVAVERLLAVESYPTVHQLVSCVTGRLRPGIRLRDLLDAAFPAGSMTGAPKLAAMTILHDLEDAPRGVFAGCFGWVGETGALDLAMVIRSVVVHPRGAYVGAGGGITWASIADEEVAEVALKARAPLTALGTPLPPGWAERVR